jgi:hypothetical protein
MGRGSPEIVDGDMAPQLRVGCGIIALETGDFHG